MYAPIPQFQQRKYGETGSYDEFCWKCAYGFTRDGVVWWKNK